ncbi:4Fe-4S dicluster domain-containing protein [Candidatus Altiarchaeota archaeon]
MTGKAYFLSGKDLDGFVKKMVGESSVYAPVSQDGITNLKKIKSFSEIDLKAEKTRVSAKQVFLQQNQKILELRVKEKGIDVDSADVEKGRNILFGVRPCDVHALELFDKVFLEDEPLDPFYKKMRENIITFALGCREPGYYCFCTSVGGDPHGSKGVDVLLTEIKEGFVAEGVTKKGSDILNENKKFLKKTNSLQVKEAQKAVEESRRKILDKIKLSDNFESKINDKWDDDLWLYQSLKCIGCGACTYLCPTCWCFDVSDKWSLLKKEGERNRCWDSCMYAGFTRMAGGHNPRETQRERLRQRINHKFNYIPEKYGLFGCTGCGRCTEHCPVDVNLGEILEEVQK